MTSTTSAAARRWLPARPSGAHKGDFGHVLLVAGSRGMTGAAVLAARAAYRAGAGLVTVGVPASQQAVVAAGCAEALTLGLPETSAGALASGAVVPLRRAHALRGYGVLALGPGLGTQPQTARAVLGLLRALRLPAVIDADGLNILAARPRAEVRELFRRRGAPCVLTPHPGELARLFGGTAAKVQASREASAKALAAALGCVCLLKGRATMITDGRRTYVNPTGNPGLAKGGTGDVLTGVIAGLWSQKLAQDDDASLGLEAAALGAWLHGAAAEAAVRQGSAYSLLASDVIEALPRAFRALGKAAA